MSQSPTAVLKTKLAERRGLLAPGAPNALTALTAADLAVHGLEDALARAAAFIEAGADVTFVEAPVSAEEMRVIPQRLRVPQLVNLVVGGKTPVLPQPVLREMGFAIVLYANAALQS